VKKANGLHIGTQGSVDQLQLLKSIYCHVLWTDW